MASLKPRHSAICWLLGFRSTAEPPDGPAARDHGTFAGELPRPMRDDERFSGVGWAHHLDLAADDDEERGGPVPDFDQHVAARDRPPASMRRDSADLRWCQRRE